VKYCIEDDNCSKGKRDIQESFHFLFEFLKAVFFPPLGIKSTESELGVFYTHDTASKSINKIKGPTYII
jgi:hypothetical protein